MFVAFVGHVNFFRRPMNVCRSDAVRGASVSCVISNPAFLRYSIIAAPSGVNEIRLRRLSFWNGSVRTSPFCRNRSTTPLIVATSIAEYRPN